MGWITPLKRPAMTVRWGIAVEYVRRAATTATSYPIGTTQNLPSKALRVARRRAATALGAAWAKAAWVPAKAIPNFSS